MKIIPPQTGRKEFLTVSLGSILSRKKWLVRVPLGVSTFRDESMKKVNKSTSLWQAFVIILSYTVQKSKYFTKQRKLFETLNRHSHSPHFPTNCFTQRVVHFIVSNRTFEKKKKTNNRQTRFPFMNNELSQSNLRHRLEVLPKHFKTNLSCVCLCVMSTHE